MPFSPASPIKKVGSGWSLGGGGDARGANSVDLQLQRSASTQVASGANSAIVGGYNNTCAASYSAIIGSVTCVANAYAQNIILGATNGTTTGNNTIIIGGSYATASAGYAIAIGGGTVSGVSAISLAGYISSGAASLAIAKGNASGDYSQGSGIKSIADKRGQHSIAAGGFYDAVLEAEKNGSAQTSVLVERLITTDATPAVMALDGTSALCTIAADSSWAFRILLVARRADARGESAGYEFSGVIDNDDGTTALVGSVTKVVLAEDTAGWDAAVTADDANDALIITVTGGEAKTIYWVARIELAEVIGYIVPEE